MMMMKKNIQDESEMIIKNSQSVRLAVRQSDRQTYSTQARPKQKHSHRLNAAAAPQRRFNPSRQLTRQFSAFVAGVVVVVVVFVVVPFVSSVCLSANLSHSACLSV